MARYAILFCAPTPGIPDDVGIETDMQSWKQYLKSEKGGGWYEHEINSSLKNPTTAQLDQALANAKNPDFLLIAFAGHGCTHKGEDTPRLCINKTETYKASGLRGHAARTLIVLDSCRDVIEISESADRQLRMKAFASVSAEVIIRHRIAYEEAFLRASTGSIFMHAAAYDQSAAGKAGIGGAYTQALIGEARNWAVNGRGVLDSQEAHNLAVIKLQSLRIEQNPEYDGGRRIYHFPFSVSV